MDLQSCFINLKLLQSVESYDKILTKQKYFQIVGPTGTIPVWLQRWWSGENREGLLHDLKQLFDYTSGVLRKREGDTEEKQKLKQHLLHSVKGLEALRKTYEADKTTVAKLELLEDYVHRIIQGRATPLEIHVPMPDISAAALRAEEQQHRFDKLLEGDNDAI